MSKLPVLNFCQIAAIVLCIRAGQLSAEEPGRKPVSNPPNKTQDQSENRIKAGFGTDEYHIGMPLSAFGEDWEHRKDGGSHSLYNRTAGIAAFIYEGRAMGFTYNFVDSKILGKCKLKTDKGIGQTHKIVDMQALYGDPSHIDLNLLEDNAGCRSIVELFYEEQGIEFKFYGNELATIAVKEPRRDFDYNSYGRSMKDWLIYIRQPKKH